MKALASVISVAAILALPTVSTASPKYTAPINVTKGTVTIIARVESPFGTDASADRLYQVRAGDVNGDGLAPTGWLRVRCRGGEVVDVWYSSRDAAPGVASGKRTHKPHRFVKKWGPSAPQFHQQVSRDLSRDKREPIFTGSIGGIPLYDRVALTAGQSTLCAKDEN